MVDPFFGSLITAGAGASGSLLNGLFSNKQTKDTNALNYKIAQETNANQMAIARENNAAQLAAMRENNEFNAQQALKMFNLENEYNSPAHQKQLLLQAGLNPATMYANGASQGLSDASTPQASSSGITPSMPNLVSPRMDVPPSVTSALFSNIDSLAGAISKVASAKMSDAQRNKLNITLDAELQKILGEADAAKASASWNQLQTELERLYGAAGRDSKVRETLANVSKLYADAALASYRGQTESVNKKLAEAEERLRSSNAKILEAQSPWLIQQAEESVNLIREQQKSERAKQSADYAAANASNASAKYTDEQRQQLEKMWKDNYHIRHMQAEELRTKVELLQRTLDAQVNYYRQQNILTDEQINMAKEEASRRAKENSAFWFTYVFDKLERTAKAAAAFVPLSGSSSGNTYSPLWSNSVSVSGDY